MNISLVLLKLRVNEKNQAIYGFLVRKKPELLDLGTRNVTFSEFRSAIAADTLELDGSLEAEHALDVEERVHCISRSSRVTHRVLKGIIRKRAVISNNTVLQI